MVAMIICKHSIHSHALHSTLKSGEQLRGKVHPDWTGGCTIESTTLDMRSAYKQLPLHKSDVNKAIVTSRDPPCGKAKHFSMCTLPFGASASVLHFNRVSVLLWALGCHLNLVWASYYDDYPIYAPQVLSNLLWELPRAMLDNIICEGKVKLRDLPSHLGRLQFADMQIAGRSGKLAMHDLRHLGSTETSYVRLNGSQVSALKLLCLRATSGEPRKLTARPDENLGSISQMEPWNTTRQNVL